MKNNYFLQKKVETKEIFSKKNIAAVNLGGGGIRQNLTTIAAANAAAARIRRRRSENWYLIVEKNIFFFNFSERSEAEFRASVSIASYNRSVGY